MESTSKAGFLSDLQSISNNLTKAGRGIIKKLRYWIVPAASVRGPLPGDKQKVETS